MNSAHLGEVWEIFELCSRANPSAPLLTFVNGSIDNERIAKMRDNMDVSNVRNYSQYVNS